MDFDDCLNYDDAEVLKLAVQNLGKAKENIEIVELCIEKADKYGFLDNSSFGNNRFNNVAFHVDSAKHLIKFTQLIRGIKTGNYIAIYCSVCGSRVVDVCFTNGFINQSCVNCGHIWDFPL